MRAARVLLMRCTPADVAVDDDERRAVLFLLEGLESPRKNLAIVRVADARDVPAVPDEPCGDIFGERECGVALDRDVVVVVDPAKIRELQVSGQRGCLAGDALHHAAVTAEGVDVVVEDVEPCAVEVLRLPFRGDRHPDGRGEAVSERPGRRLDPGGPAVLRMSRTARIELAEALQVVERNRRLAQPLVLRVDRLHARKMQERIQQRRRMPGGEDEAVAVRPDGVVRIEAQELLPQRVNHRRHRHGGPGVAGVRHLDGVHRERPDGVHAQLVDLDPRLRCDCHRSPPSNSVAPSRSSAARAPAVTADRAARAPRLPGGRRARPRADAREHARPRRGSPHRPPASASATARGRIERR